MDEKKAGKLRANPKRKPQPREDSNKNDELSRIIILSGEVEEEVVGDIIQTILEINEEDDRAQARNKNFERKPIKLIINSPGGSIYDGLALIDVMDGSTTPVHTYCYGSAMSMGMIIFVCGHYRYCGKYATIMYHEGGYSVPHEKLKTHKEEMAEMERVEAVVEAILLDRTKLNKKILQSAKVKKQDWYMDAEEAVKYKISDEII